MVKICLVGDYPPPYGGASAEVEGLSEYLRQNGQDCRIINIGENRRVPGEQYLSVQGYLDFVRKMLKTALNQYLIHLITNGQNTKSWMAATVGSLAGIFNRRCNVLTLGSGDMPDFVMQQPGWKQWWLRRVLLGYRLVIVRNDHAIETMKALGIPISRLRKVSAYTGDLQPAPEQIAPEVNQFFSTHHPVLVSAVAYRPEYGIEMALDAVKQLRSDYPGIGLIFLGAETGEDVVRQQIKERELEEHVLLAGAVARPVYLAIVQKGTLFLRATQYDGDASSVREGLALGVPVVASRTDYRPEGTVLFEIGNTIDLLEKLTLVLRNDNNSNQNIALHDSPARRLKNVLGVYREVLTQSGLSRENLPDIFQP